jgi:hypothetical protein
MRIKVNASVGIKTSGGGIDFGTVRWIDGDKLMLHSTGHLERGMRCELKLELHGAGGSIYTTGLVLKATGPRVDQDTKAVMQLGQLCERDQERLQTFIEIQEYPGVSHARLPQAISFAGSGPPPSSADTIPLRDPLYKLSDDGRRLTVRWHDGRTYRRDWALHLAHGRLPVSCAPPERRAFMLRLVLPDGFVATFPAEIAERNTVGWQARFLIPMAIRARMQQGADGTPRRLAR